MLIKELVVAAAILLSSQIINAELNKKEKEQTEHVGDRVIVEIEITEKKLFYVDTSFIGFHRHEAKSFCESLNMTMLRFETEAKWLAVSKWLADTPYHDRWFWAGGMRDLGSTRWYWEDTGAEIVRTFWIPGQPSLNSSVPAYMSVSSRGWDDDIINANYLLDAMCES